MSKKVLLVTGETSGDQHAARLVEAMRTLDPALTFIGMGGPAMKAAGVEIVVDTKHLDVVGIVEVITAFPRIFKAFRKLKQCLLTEKPDLVILIDYPGFNFRFARTAKQAGFQVMYYIAPQIWAWGASRIRWMSRYVDQVCVIFPFEVSFYQQRGVKAYFVGHPLTQVAHPSLSKTDALAWFNIQPHHPIIGLLPGSRKSEVKRLLPIMLSVAVELKQRYPHAQFIMPAAPSVRQNLAEQIMVYPELAITLTQDHFYDALSLCDMAIAASGTVTLECGLLRIPTVLLYKMNPVTAWIARKITPQRTLGICNIMTEKNLMKEFFQEAATAKNISQEIQRMIEDPIYLEEIKNQLKCVRLVLNVSEEETAATCALKLLA